MPSLDELQKELGSDTFEVVTIATGHNHLPAIKNFFERAKITTLPILLDPNQDLAQEMSIFGLPSTVILDPSGREIARLRGDAEWSDGNAFAIISALVASEGS
jgi:thiol-disulfide isomerase/thioredoxin